MTFLLCCVKAQYMLWKKGLFTPYLSLFLSNFQNHSYVYTPHGRQTTPKPTSSPHLWQTRTHHTYSKKHSLSLLYSSRRECWQKQRAGEKRAHTIRESTTNFVIRQGLQSPDNKPSKKLFLFHILNIPHILVQTVQVQLMYVLAGLDA